MHLGDYSTIKISHETTIFERDFDIQRIFFYAKISRVKFHFKRFSEIVLLASKKASSANKLIN